MNLKFPLLLSFFSLLMIGYSSCKDKDECQCPDTSVELTADNTCRCDPAVSYQLGSFDSSCDENPEKGNLIRAWKDFSKVSLTQTILTQKRPFIGDFLNREKTRILVQWSFEDKSVIYNIIIL